MKKINDNIGCFILAGGEGSRLKNLTKDTCKPLVKICSFYHLIDFSLINCLRSDISNIAVIVQYKSIDLIKYLFESNMNSLMTTFYVLPPETKQINNSDIIYKNTAHSVMMNMDYMADDQIEDILILSADHAYLMDYNLFYSKHMEDDNDLTVSVRTVSLEEASRFGVFTLDEDDNIINFEEKPPNPESTVVSMGVYLFKKEKLIEAFDYLVDEIGPDLDFGKHLLPYFLKNNKVGVYKFQWFWVDLGTVETFLDFNMRALDCPKFIKDFFVFDKRFKIEKEVMNIRPAFISDNSVVSSSFIGKNTFIEGNIKHSVIGDNVIIEKGAEIINSVIMEKCIIKEGVIVKDAVISQNTVVDEDVISIDEIICK